MTVLAWAGGIYLVTSLAALACVLAPVHQAARAAGLDAQHPPYRHADDTDGAVGATRRWASALRAAPPPLGGPRRRSRRCLVLRAAGAFAVPRALAGGEPTGRLSALAVPTPTPVAAPPWRGLSLRPRTATGIPGDPVNIGLEGSRAAILAAFQKSRWVQSDPLSPRNDARLALAFVLHRSYPRAPVSPLYLFGRPEDLAVEYELGSVARRDHARLWDTHRRDPRTHLELWIGDASRDTGVEVVRRHGILLGTTHHISPFVDAERQRIVAALRRTGVVRTVVMEPGIGLTLLGHNGAGDPFVTDGQVAVIVLTQPKQPQPPGMMRA